MLPRSRRPAARGGGSKATTAFRVALLLAQAVPFVACGEHVLVGKEEAAHVTEAGTPRESGPPLAPGELMCGEAVCGALDFGPLLGTYGPCCLGRSKCGLVLSAACIELGSVGVDDPSCPPLPPYAACCRTDGNCGVATGAPLGCITVPLQAANHCVYPDQ